MFKRLMVLIIYFAMGGVVTGPGLVAFERECKRSISMSQASMVFLTWPAWIAAALVIDTSKTNKNCSVKP